MKAEIILSMSELEIVARDTFDESDAVAYCASADRYFLGAIDGDDFVRPVISNDNVRLMDGRDDDRAIKFFNDKLGFEMVAA